MKASDRAKKTVNLKKGGTEARPASPKKASKEKSASKSTRTQPSAIGKTKQMQQKATSKIKNSDPAVEPIESCQASPSAEAQPPPKAAKTQRDVKAAKARKSAREMRTSPDQPEEEAAEAVTVESLPDEEDVVEARNGKTQKS